VLARGHARHLRCHLPGNLYDAPPRRAATRACAGPHDCSCVHLNVSGASAAISVLA
jgi:hypothetical protein